MKKLLIGLLALTSISSYANIKTIKYPSINGVSFSSDSNPNIVCNYLGYNRSISTEINNRITNVITVDKEGISSANFGYFTFNYDETVNTIDKITCVDEVELGSYDLEVPTLIKYPSTNKEKKLVSRNSSESGVCKMLGYSRSAGGTLGELVYTRKGHLVVDSDGELKSKDYSTNDVIKKVICI